MAPGEYTFRRVRSSKGCTLPTSARHTNNMRRLLLIVAAAAGLSIPAPAQNTATPATQDLVRVYMDCNASGCDGDFFRTEINWVNFVRDRADGQVHVIVTSQQTGSGGNQYTLTFEGLSTFTGVRDSMTTTTNQGATSDEQRRELVRVLSLGLARYARGTSAASQLRVTRTTGGSNGAASRGARDPWNLWVLSVSAHTFSNGDDNYTNTNVFGNVSARRVSEAWKINLRVGADYSENSYELSDGKLQTYQRSWFQNALVVKSLSPHWSAGIQQGTSSSKYQNFSLEARASAAIEYDLFPYSESTRRQLIFRYGVGVRSFDYDSITIYGKDKETRLAHDLLIAGEAKQKWGSLSIGLRGSQYLDDLSKRSASISGGIEWRIVRGLEFEIDGYYEVQRDQLNIPRGEADDEDILVRLRQLQSGFSYFVSFGLSYTFGSIFNNVVNPRFDR
jgi:hypothetical protein